MSQSQITFKMTKNLKQKALKKARAQGITLKALYTFFTEDYVQNKVSIKLDYQNIIEPEIEIIDVTPEIQEDMDEIGTLLAKKRKN